jgi:hypothetical protein
MRGADLFIACLSIASGHVLAAFKTKYPNANITQLASWTVGINGTYFLSAEDPLFAQIGSAFIAKQVQPRTHARTHAFNAACPVNAHAC